MIPSKRQWRRWSLPSRLTAIGAYVGVASLGLAAVVLLRDNLRLRSESLHLAVGSYVDTAPIDIREGYGNDLPWQLTFSYPVTIVNDGLRPATVVGYELIPWNCSYDYTFRGQDGDQGLYGQPIDDEPLVLPFAIAPAEGKTIFLKTAVVVSFHTSDIAFEMKAGSSLRDLLIETLYDDSGAGLFRSQDFFGNEVDAGMGVRGLLDYELLSPDSAAQPVYKLVVRTAAGKQYERLFAPYPVESTHPYSTNCSQEPFSKTATLQVPEDWASKRESRRARAESDARARQPLPTNTM